MTAPLRIGLLGLGTVAQGVLAILRENAELLEERCDRTLTVTRVASRTPKALALGSAVFSTDTAALVQSGDVDVVVECMGGEHPCLELVGDALRAGKSVVTANKALIAKHGDALHALAASHGVELCYEAAVAGGIPILKALTEGLAANRIERLAGIINGTSNYILTAMAEQGQDFAAALADAQRLGYAEADPTFDVDGTDAAHKLTILVGLAFGRAFAFDQVACEGISSITPLDIDYAERLGYVIKHLGVARQDDSGVAASVHPALVPKGTPLAQINGVTNAIMVGGNAVGSTVYSGAGAGMMPTASAVLADLLDLAAERPRPVRSAAKAATKVAAGTPTAYYLRLHAQDRPGAFARVTTLLSDAGISIEAALQQEHSRNAPSAMTVPIVLLTQPTEPARLSKVLAVLEALPDIVGELCVLRVEPLTE